MSNPSLRIQCPNPECLHPNNALGQKLCDRCQTPLVYRYLWAVGEGVAEIPAQTLVANRYSVVRPHLWLDTQPIRLPEIPTELPDASFPYLHLHPYHLHLPELHGFCLRENAPPVLLLDNIPVDVDGHSYASIDSAWAEVSAVRQVYWLWQLLQLWQPLQAEGVAASLLMPENLRVEGWRIRLRELVADESIARPAPENAGLQQDQGFETQDGELASTPNLEFKIQSSALSIDPPIARPALKDLATLWLSWIDRSHPSVLEPLREICRQMQLMGETEVGMRAIASHLNHLLLEQAAQLPLSLEVAGATTTGPQRSHNEDVCFPSLTSQSADDLLLPYVGIVCDGIGGHEGGEVASQLALRSLQPLLRAWLNEFLSQSEPLPPAVIAEQLIEVVRIVNNQIATQNDAQGRELRQRMGTTLVMALQPPQKVHTATGFNNTHELYLVNVGDSRAYWLTPRYCHRLTTDDDVASREVRSGNSPYLEAIRRPDASALTQALGTRDADSLNVSVQRFVIEENGLLLLCSDGLSDRDRVEQFWQEMTTQVFRDRLSLQDAVHQWIEIANQHNGHDNTSVVLLRCRVSAAPHFFEPDQSAPPVGEPAATETESAPESELTESAKALLYDEYEPISPEPSVSEPVPVSAEVAPRKGFDTWLLVMGLAALMFTTGALGIAIWRELDPIGFQQTWQKVLPASPE